MSYLFGFSGRINRARMWLFILVTLGFEIVIGLVAALGFHGTRQLSIGRELVHGMSHTSIGGMVAFRVPADNPIDWAAAGIVAILILVYVIALLAVSTKRLHDRNKSAWWLVLFLVLPFALSLLKCVAPPGLLAMGGNFGPYGVGWGTAHLIGVIFFVWGLVELFLLRGTVGENRYGPDPLAA